MKLLFTGDVNFRGQSGLTYEKSLDILSEVMPYAEAADFVIPNLECPLADEKKYTPIKKAGPNLICAPENICFLKAMGAYAVTMANNHTGDYGDGAVFDTLALLEENNIAHAGAGKNKDEAYAAMYVEKDGIKASILSVCENEFGLATKDKAGSAGYDVRMLLSRIREEKQAADRVIVVFHGGNEFNPLPSQDTQERYKLACDMGADAVVGGHTHCPQGFEIYDGKPIIYSMGNFLFVSSGKREASDSWYYGYMTLLSVDKNGIIPEIIPYKFNPEGTKITVFEGEDKKKMLDYIGVLNDIIKNPDELKEYFKGWAWRCRMWQWPTTPSSFDDLSGYNSSGFFDIIKCEAHVSLEKQLMEIFFEEDMEKAKIMCEKISALSIMPV